MDAIRSHALNSRVSPHQRSHVSADAVDGEFRAEAASSPSRLVVMHATGHCPNLSAPDETVAAIKAFLDTIP